MMARSESNDLEEIRALLNDLVETVSEMEDDDDEDVESDEEETINPTVVEQTTMAAAAATAEDNDVERLMSFVPGELKSSTRINFNDNEPSSSFSSPPPPSLSSHFLSTSIETDLNPSPPTIAAATQPTNIPLTAKQHHSLVRCAATSAFTTVDEPSSIGSESTASTVVAVAAAAAATTTSPVNSHLPVSKTSTCDDLVDSESPMFFDDLPPNQSTCA